MDDYKYQTLDLPNKNNGLFGYGGKPNGNGAGFSGRVIDSSDVYGGLGLNGSEGLKGEDGATGATGAFPQNPQKGDILYHNGNTWVELSAPTRDGILTINNKVPTWTLAPLFGPAVLLYNGQQFYAEEAPANGIYILTIRPNGTEWIPFQYE
jgi:hypothetical protein